MRKLCVVTGSRADYGLLQCLMQEIQGDESLELQIIATGTHLDEKFGMTSKIVEADGFTIQEKVLLDLSSDSPVAIAKQMGVAVQGFAEAFDRLRPDIVIALGDRYEMFAACSAAVPLRIPIAHIHGGETSQGAMDESFRHAMTKMSHFHFVSTTAYKDRVVQLGETPENIYWVGAPGLDQLKKIDLLDRESLAKELSLNLSKKFFLVTFHPVTLENNSAEKQFQELLEALKSFEDAEICFTQPNADTEGQVIQKMIEAFVAQSSGNAVWFHSLGTLRYLSALKHADVVIGNSSSAIVEAPSLKTAAVNIGDRQKGRLMAANVIQSEPTQAAIVDAIKSTFDDGFQKDLQTLESPYERGEASWQIKEVLKHAVLSERTLKKRFYDLPSAKELTQGGAS